MAAMSTRPTSNSASVVPAAMPSACDSIGCDEFFGMVTPPRLFSFLNYNLLCAGAEGRFLRSRAKPTIVGSRPKLLMPSPGGLKLFADLAVERVGAAAAQRDGEEDDAEQHEQFHLAIARRHFHLECDDRHFN